MHNVQWTVYENKNIQFCAISHKNSTLVYSANYVGITKVYMTCPQSAPVARSLAMYRDPLTGPIIKISTTSECFVQQHHLLRNMFFKVRHVLLVICLGSFYGSDLGMIVSETPTFVFGPK